MKKVLLMAMMVVAGGLESRACDPGLTEKRVVKAAAAIEKINGLEEPKTTMVLSYSSLKDTWAVIFDSGISERVWKIKTDEEGCAITSVTMSEGAKGSTSQSR
jgi:hypothetical protein